MGRNRSKFQCRSVLVMTLVVALDVVLTSTTTLAPDPLIRHESHRMRATKLRNPAPFGVPHSGTNCSSDVPEASTRVQPARLTRVVHSANRMVSGWPELLAATTVALPSPQPQGKRLLRAAVLAPSDPDHQFSLKKILPAITLAARTIERSGRSGAGPLPGWNIEIVDRDSKCSSVYGPLEAFDLYNNNAIGAIRQAFQTHFLEHQIITCIVIYINVK